jgi:hypothetical protein
MGGQQCATRVIAHCSMEPRGQNVARSSAGDRQGLEADRAPAWQTQVVTKQEWGGFWTPESWRRYRNWADQVWVELHFVEYPSLPSEEDWLIVSQVGAAWDQDWLVSRVEELGHAPPQQVEGQPPRSMGEPLYDMRVQDAKFSWGADAAALEILMDVSKAVLGAAAWEGTRRLARVMAARLRDREEQWTAKPLSEEEAIERVRWMLGKRYSIREEELSLRSVELAAANGTATVQLVDQAGATYSCELISEDGLVLVARVRREAPPASA